MVLQINQVPSPNYFSYNLGFRAIVCHGTAGPGAASEGWLRNPGSNASANFMIWPDGTIDCLVSPWLGRSAWANGIVQNPDRTNALIAQMINSGSNVNCFTISIEHVAASADMIAHRTMPAAQQMASQLLIIQLCQDFHIPLDRVHVIGHYQLDSVDRANCPGVINLDQYVPQIQQRLAAQSDQITMNGHTIRGEILKYWRRLFNPTLVNGLPLTEEFVDPADGRTTQVYERAVLKFYPENIGTDWVVIGQLLGQAARPATAPAVTKPVAGLFKAYSDRLFNPLVVLGQPISDPFMAPDGRPTQYFERAVLKDFREFPNSDWEIQGDQLGRAWLTSHKIPA